MGSQCNSLKSGVTWANFGRLQINLAVHMYFKPAAILLSVSLLIPGGGGGGGGGTPISKVTGTCRWTGCVLVLLRSSIIGTGYLNWLLAGYSVYHRVAFQGFPAHNVYDRLAIWAPATVQYCDRVCIWKLRQGQVFDPQRHPPPPPPGQ